LLLFRLRNLAVRAETLDIILPRPDDVSEKARTLLPESNTLAASSDLAEEYVLVVRIDAVSLTISKRQYHPVRVTQLPAPELLWNPNRWGIPGEMNTMMMGTRNISIHFSCPHTPYKTTHDYKVQTYGMGSNSSLFPPPALDAPVLLSCISS
jgi:hypothetical protein